MVHSIKLFYYYYQKKIYCILKLIEVVESACRAKPVSKKIIHCLSKIILVEIQEKEKRICVENFAAVKSLALDRMNENKEHFS